jgi:DedD protein
MADNQEALDLRRKARRRLIGALALVLALVLVPPWVMDLEPKPVVTNLTVEIPKQETTGLKPPAAPAPEPPAETTPPRPPDVDPATGKSGERPKPAPPKVETKSEPVARAAPPEAVRAVPPEAPRSPPEPRPNPEPPRPNPDAKRAEAILNAENFVVPVAAFTNPHNAKELEAKLAKAGVKHYSEMVGTQTRVRAGPFATKEAAEQARDKLKTLGINPGAVTARP